MEKESVWKVDEKRMLGGRERVDRVATHSTI